MVAKKRMGDVKVSLQSDTICSPHILPAVIGLSQHTHWPKVDSQKCTKTAKRAGSREIQILSHILSDFGLELI